MLGTGTPLPVMVTSVMGEVLGYKQRENFDNSYWNLCISSNIVGIKSWGSNYIAGGPLPMVFAPMYCTTTFYHLRKPLWHLLFVLLHELLIINLKTLQIDLCTVLYKHQWKMALRTTSCGVSQYKQQAVYLHNVHSLHSQPSTPVSVPWKSFHPVHN